MAQIHIQRISNKLNELFLGLIDEKDPKRFNSKALACFYLKHWHGISNEEAVFSLTDGYKDCGIDAIYTNHSNKTLILVQSKFTTKDNSSPGKDCVLKFLEGFELLLDRKFDSFNEKVKSREEELSKILFGEPFKIELVLIHSGTGKLSSECIETFEEKKAKINDIEETLNYRVYDQKQIYQILMANVDGEPINLREVHLSDWGVHSDPLQAYYGKVEAITVAEWFKKFGMRMLIKNIRQYDSDTQINRFIYLTLINRPSDFWYFNNGIVLLCRKIHKTLVHGNTRSKGVFHLEDVYLVNGAQTFGCVGDAALSFPDEVANASVMIKIIELGESDEKYYKEITKYTNTQNKIIDRDFAALDPQQERLRLELKMDGVEYVFKFGEKIKNENSGFDIQEATTVLACAQDDIEYTAIAKTNPGKFWENIDDSKYQKLFNNKLSSIYLWNLVKIKRIIESRLAIHQKNDFGDFHTKRIQKILIHGKWIIVHKVLNYLDKNSLYENSIDWVELKQNVELKTVMIVGELAKAQADLFDDDPAQDVFKNRAKIKRLSEKLDHQMGVKNALFQND